MGIIADRYGSFDNPPLVYTLFALGFPRETALDSAIPAIQRSLKSKYPIYEVRPSQSIEINQDGKGNQKISTTVENEHLFFCPNRETGIVLKPDKLVFHTVRYDGFPAFRGWLDGVLNTVIDTLEISVYRTVGIRYVDAISPPGDETKLENSLNERLLPMQIEQVGLACKHAAQTHIYETDEGYILLKSYWLFENAPCIPPELEQSAQLLSFEEYNRKAPFVVLDFDHNYTCPNGKAADLNCNQLLEKIERMHDATSSAFICAINETAVKDWK